MKRTMLSLFLIIVLSVLSGCVSRDNDLGGSPGPLDDRGSPSPVSGPKPQGQEVGNGGNYLPIIFEQGRIYAVNVLDRVSDQDFPKWIKALFDENDFQLMIKNKDELIGAIKASSHVWSESLPTSCASENKCACTWNLSTIYFSYSSCEHVTDRKQAGSLLIHESVHQIFKKHNFSDEKEEQVANRIAASFYAAWSNKGHPNEPHWLTMSTTDLPGNQNRPLWTGERLFTWWHDEIGYYDPNRNLSETVKTGNSYLEWMSEEIKKGQELVKGQIAVWAGGKAVLFGGCYESQQNEGSGVVYNPGTNRWELMTIEGAPKGRYWAHCVSNGKKLLVFGGVDCDSGRYVFDGAVYDPIENSWHGIKDTELIKNRDGYGIVFINDKLMVWGGRSTGKMPIFNFEGAINWDEDAVIDSDVLNTGATYDLSSDAWSPISEENSATKRAYPILIPLDNRVLVYGGDEHPVHLWDGQYLPSEEKMSPLASGKIYNFRENIWESSVSEGGPPALDSKYYTVAWSGTEVIFVRSKDVYFYNPFYNRWKKPNDRFVTPEFNLRNALYSFWTGFELIAWNGPRSFLLYP